MRIAAIVDPHAIVRRFTDRTVGRTRLISAKGYGPFSSAKPGAWQNNDFDGRLTFEL